MMLLQGETLVALHMVLRPNKANMEKTPKFRGGFGAMNAQLRPTVAEAVLVLYNR